MLMNAAGTPITAEPEVQDVASAVSGIVSIFRRRYITFIAIVVMVLVLTVGALALMTPKYSAVARVRIDPTPVAPNGSTVDQNKATPDQAVVDTEVGVIGSRDIAAAVVKQLKLDLHSEFTEDLYDPKSPLTQAQRTEIVVARVLGKQTLNIGREKSTYLVDISFRAKNPVLAAAAANAFATNYINFTVSRRNSTAGQQYEWLDKRLANLSQQAKNADAALAQYRAANGITSGTAGTITDQQIAPLSSQVALAEAAAAAAHSDLNVAKGQMEAGGAGAASSVLNSPAIAALRQNRAAVEQQIGQLSVRYGPKHPQTVQAQQQLNAINQQIGEEAERIVGELQAKAHAADAQAGSLASQLAQLRGELASNGRLAVTADALSRDADTKHNAYNQLATVTQQVDQLSKNSLSQAQIIESAVPPLGPSSPKTKLILALGVLLALGLGVGTITLLELLSSGFMTISDVERILGIKYMASVPALKIKRGSPSDGLMTSPMSVFAEAFRTVRSSLLLSVEQPPQVIAVVSTLANEGKTTSALGLARILAMSGERTILIDGDLRRPGLSALFTKSLQIGLLQVLRDKATLRSAIFPDEVSDLDILGTAPGSIETTDVFGGAAMTQMITTLRENYDRIVIDTPPVLGVTDARTIAAAADAVVLVIKWNSTPRAAVKTAVKWLRTDNAVIAGAMLTMVSPKSEAFGALYYSRATAKYYQM